MTAALVLGVVVLALVAFWTEALPAEVVSLLVVFVLAATRVLTPEEAFAGFSDDTVIFIFTLLAMAQGMATSGLVQLAGQRLGWVARGGRRALLAGIMLVTAFFSAFVSNTVTTAALLPVTLAVAQRAKVRKREVLLPMAYASMLGGTILLFGTSTNLVMSAVMARSGLGPLGVTELARLGLPLTLLSIALLTAFAPRLLRTREGDEAQPVLPARSYLTELVLPEDSPHLGKPLEQVAGLLGFRVHGVVHDGEARPAHPDHRLDPRDRLVIEAQRDDIARAKHVRGIDIGSAKGPAAPAATAVLVEASVPPGSPLAGRSIAHARLPDRCGFEVLGMHRRPTLQRLTRLQMLGRAGGAPELSALPLAPGDVLLLRGPADRIQDLGDGTVLLVLTGTEEQAVRPGKAALALVLFLGALAAGSTGLLPLSVAGLAGMLAMILTGCIDARHPFRFDWRVVLVIGSMMALALAMEKSGAGRLLGEGVAQLAGVAGPRGVLAALLVLTIVLSAPMSNQAAALVVFPVAVSAAAQLGVDPRPFAIGVTLAASFSLVTPLEPSAMLVFGVGRYRFSDFVRVGGPLTLLLVALLTFAVPRAWPLEKSAAHRRAAAATGASPAPAPAPAPPPAPPPPGAAAADGCAPRGCAAPTPPPPR